LSFQYNSTFVKPYTLINFEEEARTATNKPFMYFDLEKKNGAGHLDVILDESNSISFYPKKIEFYSPALHSMAGINMQFPLEM